MQLRSLDKEQWEKIREIYMEAFPKQERKPFGILKRSVKRGKVELFAAWEGTDLLGFTAVIPFENMVMVDYLAVSAKARGKGTGSQLMDEACGHYTGKKVVLLIERLDDQAENAAQRQARRRFYLKNGFASTDLFTSGAGGDMEVLSFGGQIPGSDYMRLQKYALGSILFRLSGMKLVKA